LRRRTCRRRKKSGRPARKFGGWLGLTGLNRLTRRTPVDRYIGLDVHAQGTAVGVVSSNGKRLASHLVETNAAALIELVETIPGNRRLVLEEGTQSEWLSQVLRPHVQELVVMVPQKKDARRTKSDFEDAFARAEDLRRNAIDTAVYKPSMAALPLRDAVRLYTVFTIDSTRAKNRFRAQLRSRGVTEQIDYDPEPSELEKLLKKLPPSGALNATAMLEEIYYLEDLRGRACELMVGEAQKSSDFRLLKTVPGIWDIRAATLLAVVVTPERFRKSHHFWSYCGLGISTTASAEYGLSGAQWKRCREPMTRGLRRGHPLLKGVFRGAAEMVSRSEKPLGMHYRHLVKNGMKENLAKLTLARKLAAITLAVWKTKKEYDPTKHHSFE
jgi:transposase